jgi:hypothetical protein
MPMLHKIVPRISAFVSGFWSVGVKGPFEVLLTPEDGERLAAAIQGQHEIKDAPFAPDENEVFHRTTIAGVTFTWSTRERP